MAYTFTACMGPVHDWDYKYVRLWAKMELPACHSCSIWAAAQSTIFRQLLQQFPCRASPCTAPNTINGCDGMLHVACHVLQARLHCPCRFWRGAQPPGELTDSQLLLTVSRSSPRRSPNSTVTIVANGSWILSIFTTGVGMPVASAVTAGVPLVLTPALRNMMRACSVQPGGHRAYKLIVISNYNCFACCWGPMSARASAVLARPIPRAAPRLNGLGAIPDRSSTQDSMAAEAAAGDASLHVVPAMSS